MKRANNRWLQLMAVLVLGIGTLFGQTSAAQGSASIVYAGKGTTVNGNAAYTSAVLHPGDQVATGTDGAKLVLGEAEIQLSPNVLITVGEPLVLQRGTVTVTRGPLSISHNGNPGPITLTTGQSASSVTGCANDCLPDAPSQSMRNQQGDQSPVAAAHRSHRRDAPAASASGGFGFTMDRRVADLRYWTLTSAMFSTSITGAELTVRCIDQGRCNNRLADAPHNRALVYGVGLPADAGVAYLTYYLKKKRSRFWFVPAAIVTGGSTYFTIHSAHWLSKSANK